MTQRMKLGARIFGLMEGLDPVFRALFSEWVSPNNLLPKTASLW